MNATTKENLEVRRYTAKEMRETADGLKDDPGMDALIIADMLRQAADEQKRLDSILDAIEKEFKKQSTCRSCEWRGKSIRSEQACPCDEDENFSVYEIDIVDRLRQAADMMEREEKREKKYEYSVLPVGINGVYRTIVAARLRAAMMKSNGFQHQVVRREVGEWEEVKE